MPRVPQAEIPQSTLRPLTPTEGPRTPSLAAFGGGQGYAAFGQGLGHLAGSVLNIGMMRGEAEAKQAEVEFSDQLREMLHKGETGYFAQRGKNAVDMTATVQSQIAALRDERSKALSGYARQVFDEASTRRMQMSLEQVASHNMRETHAWMVGESQARVDNLITEAVTNYVNPLQANEYLAAAEKEMMTLSLQQGFDAEQTKNAMGRMRSTFARGLLERVAQNKPEMLDAYFEKFNGSLQGNDAAQIERMMGGIRQKNTINSTAAALLQNSIRPNVAAADRAEMALSLTGGDPVLAQAAMTQASLVIDAREKQQKQAQRKTMGQLSLHIVQGGTINDIDPVILSEIGDEGMMKLLTLSEKRQNTQSKADGDSQFKALIGLRAENPRAFADADLAVEAPDLTEQQWTSLTASQDKINAEGYVETTADRVAKDWIKGNGDLLRGADIDPTSNKGGKKKERDLFMGRMIADVSAFMDENNKRKPNPKELGQIVSNLLEDTNKGWFGSDKIYELDRDSLSENETAMAGTILDLVGQSPLKATFGAQKKALDALNDAIRTAKKSGRTMTRDSAAGTAAALMVIPQSDRERYRIMGLEPEEWLDYWRDESR